MRAAADTQGMTAPTGKGQDMNGERSASALACAALTWQQDKRHRGPILVNRDMQAEVGMRVRKSKVRRSTAWRDSCNDLLQERLEFVQQNGWEDLSDGRAGSIVSLLVSSATRDRVSSLSS